MTVWGWLGRSEIQGQAGVVVSGEISSSVKSPLSP